MANKDTRAPIVRALLISLICLSFLSVIGCPFPSSGWFPIRASSAAITLEWDPPEVQFPLPPLALSMYRIYWRQHLNGGWNFLAEIPATPHPAFLIKHSDLGDGDFDFAVGLVNSGGSVSILHSSLDSTAVPLGGWYLVWASK